MAQLWHRLLLIPMLAFSALAGAKDAALPAPLAEKLPVFVIFPEGGGPSAERGVVPQFAYATNPVAASLAQGIHDIQSSDNQRRIEPVKALLSGYPFEARFEAGLRSRLPIARMAPNVDLTIAHAWDPAKAKAAAPNGGPVLVMLPQYGFDETFRRLQVVIVMQVIRMPAPGSDQSSILATRWYRFEFRVEGKNPGISGMAKRWAQVPAEQLTRMYDFGIEQSLDLLAHDFSRVGADVELKDDLPLRYRYMASLIRKECGYVWYSSPPDILFGTWPIGEDLSWSPASSLLSESCAIPSPAQDSPPLG